MKQKHVNKSNEDQVWNMLFSQHFLEYQSPKFKVGDTVRISKYKSVFTKGCKANFLEELFKAIKVMW